MYGLTDTTEGIFETFRRAEEGKATKRDYARMRSHIEEKKASIKKARQERDMDGHKGKPRIKEPVSFDPMCFFHGRQVRKNLDLEWGNEAFE